MHCNWFANKRFSTVIFNVCHFSSFSLTWESKPAPQGLVLKVAAHRHLDITVTEERLRESQICFCLFGVFFWIRKNISIRNGRVLGNNSHNPPLGHQGTHASFSHTLTGTLLPFPDGRQWGRHHSWNICQTWRALAHKPLILPRQCWKQNGLWWDPGSFIAAGQGEGLRVDHDILIPCVCPGFQLLSFRE